MIQTEELLGYGSVIHCGSNEDFVSDVVHLGLITFWKKVSEIQTLFARHVGRA